MQARSSIVVQQQDRNATVSDDDPEVHDDEDFQDERERVRQSVQVEKDDQAHSIAKNDKLDQLNENEIEMRSAHFDDEGLQDAQTATKLKGEPNISRDGNDKDDGQHTVNSDQAKDVEFKGDPVHQPQDDKIVIPDDIDLADERDDLSDSW